MRKRTSAGVAAVFAAVSFFGLQSNSADAAAITSGELVVSRIGDGVTATGAAPVNLDVYDVTYVAGIPTSISLSQTIAAPSGTGTAPSSGNRWLQQGYTAAGEGGLSLSTNGAFLALAGYNQATGVSTNGGSASTEDRIVGLVNISTGTIDTTTAYQGFSGATNGAIAARGAVTTNGTDVWLSSSVSARYGVGGGNVATMGVALAASNNARRNAIFNGQLYQTEGANSRFGAETIGTGLPTTSGQTITLLPGMPTASSSSYDMFFADANTLYIADDRTTTLGGLQKWLFNGSTWSLAYTKNLNTAAANNANGLSGLTGTVDGSGNVTLFVTSSRSGSQAVTAFNDLEGLTDTLTNTSAALVTENLLATSASGFNMRGVALIPQAPEPGTFALISIAAPMVLRRRRKA